MKRWSVGHYFHIMECVCATALAAAAVAARCCHMQPRRPEGSLVSGWRVTGAADFDRDGSDELVAGWRGKPWGLAMFSRASGKWVKTMIDDGVAVEDLAVGDLDGDGRPEIVAGGRATGNIRIYAPVERRNQR